MREQFLEARRVVLTVAAMPRASKPVVISITSPRTVTDDEIRRGILATFVPTVTAVLVVWCANVGADPTSEVCEPFHLEAAFFSGVHDCFNVYEGHFQLLCKARRLQAKNVIPRFVAPVKYAR